MSIANVKMKEIKVELEEQLHHSYLKQFLQKPVIDEDKLLILISIIEHTNYSEIEKKNYVITTMLVQIALDTHDLVSQNSLKTDSDITRKKRQLTVLAGDYYSGLYYYLLSKLEDIPMIQTLASAIKEINEYKVSFYYKEFKSIHAFMESLKHLESLLILRVAQHMHQSDDSEFTGNWLLIRKLIREKNRYLDKGNSPIFDLITKGPGTHLQNNQIIYTVEKFIHKYTEHVEDTFSHLPMHLHTLKSYVQALTYDNLRKNIKVMEES
ncbi:heptaprenyl diphosphate synthase component 1 [Aquibacillus albus]|uniref:Heptaprenyl diphosphate synthase n=1 Tax=Aquibacillus albus TaxID=1168171 RepID=A0ABS2MVK3_9BACI|nr:heptaprenyl diphosphate synthase component 1 [Aquibacillus albus]MBM7569823.1 heptaprenyl diphosphate synthase [Aquibacillus albus]